MSLFSQLRAYQNGGGSITVRKPQEQNNSNTELGSNIAQSFMGGQGGGGMMQGISGMMGGAGGGMGGMMSGIMGGAGGAGGMMGGAMGGMGAMAGGPWAAIAKKVAAKGAQGVMQSEADLAGNTIGGIDQGPSAQQIHEKNRIKQPMVQSPNVGMNVANGGMKRYNTGGGTGDFMGDISKMASGPMTFMMEAANMMGNQVSQMFNRKNEEQQRNQLAFEQDRATQASSVYAQKNSPYGYQAAEGGKKPSIWQLFLNNNQSYGPTGNYANGGDKTPMQQYLMKYPERPATDTLSTPRSFGAREYDTPEEERRQRALLEAFHEKYGMEDQNSLIFEGVPEGWKKWQKDIKEYQKGPDTQFEQHPYKPMPKMFLEHGGKSGTIPGNGHPKADNIAIDLEEGAHVAPAEYADRAKSLLASVGVNPNQMYPVKSGGAPDSMISSSEVVISPEHISEIKEKHDMSDADVEATLHPNSPYNQYVKNGGKIYNMMGGNYQNGGTQISSGLQGLNKLGTNFAGEKREGQGIGSFMLKSAGLIAPIGGAKVSEMAGKMGVGEQSDIGVPQQASPASTSSFKPSSDPALMNPNRYTGATVDATGEATDMVPNQGFGAKPAPGTLTPEGQEGSLTKGAMGTKQAPSTAITGSLTSEGQAGSLLKDVDMSVFGMMNGGKKRMYQEGGENLYSDEEHQYADAEFPSIDEIEREIERESDPNYVPPSPYVGGHDLSPKTMPILPEVDFPTPVFKLEAEKRHSLSGPLRGQRGEDIDKMEKLPMPSGKPIYPSSNQDIRMEGVDVPDLSGDYQKEEKPSLMDTLKDPYNQRKLGQLGEMGANALAMAANRAQRPTEVKGTAAPLVSPIRRRYSAIAQAMKADADKSIAGQRSRMRGAGMKEAVSSAVVGPQDVAAKLKIAGAIEGMKGEDQAKTAAMQTQAKFMGAQIKARERATNAMLKERFGARQGEAISKNLAQMGNISDVMSKEAIMQEEVKLGKRESIFESLKEQSKALAASGKKKK